jgi:hypothetical protein
VVSTSSRSLFRPETNEWERLPGQESSTVQVNAQSALSVNVSPVWSFIPQCSDKYCIRRLVSELLNDRQDKQRGLCAGFNYLASARESVYMSSRRRDGEVS